MRMVTIIIVFIKLMGAAISGHWTVFPDSKSLRGPGTLRDYAAMTKMALF